MKEISVNEAHHLMQDSPDCVYLDVRSVPEFEQGHPERAINVPIMHFIPGMGMSPNQDFVNVVQANIPKDAPVVIGCRTGARSANACEVLSSLGYTNVSNIRGGFMGVTDPFGRIIEPGWSLLNLPQCSDCPDDAKYEHLAGKPKQS